jgi:hypothetical protein
MNPWINAEQLRWESDYDGGDIGYDGVKKVSFYSWRDALLEIDAETGEILNISVFTADEIASDRIGC